MNEEEWVAFLLPYYVEAKLLDEQDHRGYSALFTAIENRNKYLAALLLAHGASTDIRDGQGFNALQFSCTLENLDMFYFLKSFLEKLDELRGLMASKNQA
jgi:ankyrin repeat protein